MEKHKHPFTLYTEVSINLSDDAELMQLMARAGFDQVFVGIESPNDESLAECSKLQNRNRDLIASVRKIQQAGLEVQAGFIVGFDKDPDSIFERLIAFIQESGIVTAMVGLLNAPHGTKLYHRMKEEGRLIKSTTGDNTDFSINFVPKMNNEALLSGYRSILSTIYSPKHYYARVKKFLQEYRPVKVRGPRYSFSYLKAGIRSIFRLGIIGRERFQYWKLLSGRFSGAHGSSLSPLRCRYTDTTFARFSRGMRRCCGWPRTRFPLSADRFVFLLGFSAYPKIKSAAWCCSCSRLFAILPLVPVIEK